MHELPSPTFNKNTHCVSARLGFVPGTPTFFLRKRFNPRLTLLSHKAKGFVKPSCYLLLFVLSFLAIARGRDARARDDEETRRRAEQAAGRQDNSSSSGDNGRGRRK
jgi:hypothetical protein